MVCRSCGARNSEELKFCSQCGRGLDASADNSRTLYVDEPAQAAAAAAGAGAHAAMTWGSLPAQAISMPSVAPTGSMFGRYRIESLLGEGGMGAVYKAFDTELDRTVALKLVRPELAINPQTMKRFKQELLLASRISHRNVLRIHDLGDANGIKFITMAFVEGADLANLIDRTGALPIDRAVAFTRQLCGALEAAHAEGVVHRDLKPQNILVGAADNLYVSDFGLAKSLEAEISMGTRTGQILGTPRYMSPEQVEAKDVDHRSDLYSAGLILYEMFTGELPFRGDSAMQLMYQRVSEQPRDPRRARRDLPDYLANIILKCLEKDPARRYQSAREILTDLEQQNTPVVTNAGGQTISIQIRKPTRRGARLALAVTVTILSALAAIPQSRQAILAMLPGASAKGIRHYVGVMPLTVVGDDLQYIAEGVEDSLTAKLSGLRDVYVADRSQVTLVPADARQDDAKVAKALGIKLVIRGTVQSSGDRIAVTLRVQDTQKGNALLTREFTGVREDLLTLQDQIFGAVAGALLIKQTEEERARTAARPTSDVAAYDLYLRGQSLVKGKRDAATATEALNRFKEAVKADPTFALAYAGIADASIRLFKATNDEALTEQALGAAEQAERLNPNLPQVHNALGTVYTNIGKKVEGIAEFKRALELAPNSDDALRRLGKAYLDAGRVNEAIAAFQEAVRINRYYWNNHNLLAGAYRSAGELRKAISAYQEVVQLKPDYGWNNLGATYFDLDEWEAAIPALQKASSLDPSMIYNVGVANYFLGKFDEAAAAFEGALQRKPDEPNIALSLAEAYRGSKQAEKADAMYERATSSALKALKADPNNADALTVLAACAAVKGQHADALRYIRQARQIDPKTTDLIYREASVHAYAHRWSDAIQSLRQALQNGYSLKATEADPELRDLRARPEFQELLKSLPKKSTR